jgi:amino acid adenylation domain-containing protein
VKIRGFRIELGEIEARLLGHPEVREVVVALREDGEGDRRLVAYYTGGKVEAEALRNYLIMTLPDYMTPAAYVHLDKLPLAPNGKLDRRALPAPDVMRVEEGDGYLSPRTPVEEIVAGIFVEVLKLDRVGRRENFFDLGGHSLLATQVISRVRDSLGVEIGVRSVFEKPTAEGLAGRIEDAMRAGEKALAPPLARVEREGVSRESAPLSFAQQRLWFIDQLNPGSAVYNITGAVRLDSGLKLYALELAINEIVRRHEILRTRFEALAGEPAQVVDAWAPRSLDITDLTSLPTEEREKELNRIAGEEAETGFDLSRGPLLKVKVLKLEEDDHLLLYTMHHIVSDGWSMGILIREVETLYQAYLAGEESPLPDLEIQYADFAVWQRAYLAGEVLEREVGYWREQLKDVAVLELHADLPRPAAPSHRGGLERIELDHPLSEGLRRLSRREGATIFMTLMAAFKALLMRYSRQEDVSVGTVIANRTRKEIEGLIGFFVNTLVMRTDLSGNPSFAELLKREREVALGAYAHQELPFEKLVEELNPQRDLSRSPLFQVMMLLEHAGRETLELPGVKPGGDFGEWELGKEAQTAKFDLTLSITDLGRELAGSVGYSLDLFEAGTIKRFINHYANALGEIVKDSEKPISELSLLSEGERKQIVEEWNATSSDYAGERLIHELFEEQAERSPQAVALVREEQRLTYGELNRRANRLAWRLRELGVGPEGRVAICVERGPEMVVAMLATLKAGGAYAPLDPDYPAERLAYMLEDTAPVVLLTRGAAGAALAADTVGVSAVDLEADEWEWAANCEANPYRAVAGMDARSLAYILYTSGSTGQPKGVAIEHRSVVNFICWAKTAFEAEELGQTLFATSINFDLAVYECFVPLTVGATVTIVGNALDLGRTSAEVTLVNTVPSAMRSLLETEGVPKSVRTVNLAGEPLGRELVEGIFAETGVERVCNLYGPSETTTYSTWVSMKRGEGFAPHIGRPIANTRIYILDGGLEPSAVGVRGEIQIGGEGCARGYLNRPEMTAERFAPDGLSGERGERVYKTGDLGRWNVGGAIEFLGRNDLQVKIRGFRIELGEIEARLNSHPDVREAVVLAVEGVEGDKRLVAYYTGEEVGAEALRGLLAASLPDYMTPTVYVHLEKLPLTPNGKLDRRALPAPDLRRAEGRDAYPAPLKPVVEIVVGIFQDILKLDQVGKWENFFDLGGHSLLATQVISQIRKIFGVEIGVRSVFEKPTADGLAGRIEEALRTGENAPIPLLVRASRKERMPLSFAQQRLWLLDQLIPNTPLYNIPGALRLKGRLNLDALERSVNEIVRRHEILRTRIEVEAGEPAQVIEQWAPRRLEVVDLTSLPQEQREEEVSRIVEKEAETGFDLNRGPLLRVKVLKLEEDEQVLLYTMHHIVSDGWSIGILVKEVGTLYQAYSAGQPSPLDELPIQYVDYAVWQREWLEGEALERQLAYWRKQLAGAPPLELPMDRLRPAVLSYRGGRQYLIVERELAQNLRRLSRSKGLTLYMTLLAAFKSLLYRYSRQTDISVGTPIAGRNFSDIEPLIGFFVNTLVLRTDLSGEPSANDLMNRVKEVALGAYARQDLPFDKLVAELQVERETNRSPLFQVMLALQNLRAGGLEMRDLRLSDIEAEKKTAKFDLDLEFVETGAELAGVCTYSADLYEAQTIERMLKHYLLLLSSIAKDPERKIWELEMMSEEENAQICAEWNNTYRRYPVDMCIPELFEEQVIRTPHNLAAVYRDQQLTYSQLNDQVNRLSRRLMANGVERGNVVPILIDSGLELVVAMLAVMKSGAAFVPLDPNWPAARIREAFNELRRRVVLINKSVEIEWLQEELSDCSVILVNLEGEEELSESTANPGIKINPDDPIYVIYTSGSTGKPKGVINIHRGITNRLLWMNEYWGAQTAQATLQVTRHFYDSAVWQLMWPLINGGKTVLPVPEYVADADYLMATIEEQSVTIIDLVPSVLNALVPQLVADERSRRKLRSLRSLIVGGEEIKIESALRFKNAFPEVRVINMYGPTEASIGCIHYEVTGDEEWKIPIGKPITNAHALIVDENGRLVPVGVKGEIYIGGMCVGLGYLGDEEKTKGSFIEKRYEGISYDRFYKTGDLARWRKDGNIEFLGRVDEQIKIRGVRIEPEEIEASLRRHENVKEIVVAAKEDGNGSKHLVAYYVEEGSRKVDAIELREYALKRLPEYMTPRYYVAMDRLPLSASGKIDRRGLAAPQFEQVGDRTGEETPRTAIEEILIGIWSEAFKIDQIGVEDNFFNLGGHSLLATQVISRVRNAFKLEAPLRKLFDTPILRDFARSLEEEISAAARGENSAASAPALKKADMNTRPPLSFAQQRLWFIDRLNPGGSVYNIPGAVRLKGALNLDALERTINEIVRRHEVLRTRIGAEAGEPVQVIDAWEARKLEALDLTGVSPKEREVEISRIAEEEAGTGFDLSLGPLLRIKVLKLEEEEHVLLYTMHHIVSDEWSTGILIKEVGALYQAYLAGEESPLPQMEIQYADFAIWQREYLSGEVLEKEVGYWREQLQGAEVLELPTDRSRPAEPSYRGGLERIELGREVSESLRNLSRRVEATLFMTLMAAFKVVLMRYSGLEDISVGTVIANRARKEVEGLIGFFVNTLVMRTDLSGNPSFSELLKREREVALGAYAHQELPFEKLVEELNPERDLSRNPLFQVMMTLQHARSETLDLPGVKLSGDFSESGLGKERQTGKFDLTLSITDLGRELAGGMEYSLDLFEAGTIKRLISHYANVLEGIAKDSARPISELSLLSDQEREQIILGWNETSNPYPEDQRIHQLFEQQAERTPEAVAVVYERGCLTYGELNRRANQLGRYIQRMGVGPEVVVGVCLERSTEMAVAVLGTLKAGGAYLPLDPTYPAERLNFMAEDAAAPLIVTKEKFGGQLMRSAALICVDSKREEIARESDENLESEVGSDHLAYVIYTSGSTGRPKGTMIAHRSVVNLATDAVKKFRLGPESRFLQFASLSFDVAVEEIYPVWSVGGSIALQEENLLYSYTDLARTIEQHEITTIELPTVYWREWAHEMSRNGSVAPRSLDLVIIAGERVSPEILKEWKKHDVSLLHVYGVTEATVTSTTFLTPGDLADRANLAEIPIGLPMANTEVYLLDKKLQPMPLQIPGEIYLGGAGLARGYLNRPELTAERFTPSSFGKQYGARLYKTGDLARFSEEGWIEFIGRSDAQVKVRGYRIELGEIESQLARHPAIKEAVAQAREDDPGDKRLVVYYTVTAAARSQSTVDAETLRMYLSSSLPAHMVPGAYVELESLPLTPNGKLDRRALPRPDNAGAACIYEAPLGATEVAVARIWAETLKVDRVGRYDNFFELGGHSLLALKLIERMRSEGLQTDVRTLFITPTLSDFVAALGPEKILFEAPPNLIPPACEAITPEMLPLAQLTQREIDNIVGRTPGGAANIQDIYPLAPLQEGMLFHHLLANEGDVYLGFTLLAFDTRARLDRFLQALQLVINRHDILRTSVQWEGLSGPVQVVWRQAALVVEEVSLGAEAGDVAEELYARFDPLRYRFDIRQAPLMRVYIAHDTRNDRWIMLHLFHHLSVDHVTSDVLLEEIQAHLLGRVERLPATPPFRNFVAQARLGVSREDHEMFFRKMLGDVDEPTAPYGLIDVHGDGADISEVSREVDAALASRLRRISRTLGVSPAILYHLAWALVLRRVSGRDDVVFGTVLFGRLQGVEGSHRALGMLINTLPVRIQIGDKSVEKSVRQTHQLMTELIRHEHAPLSLVQGCSAVDPPKPLFSAHLNYRYSGGVEKGESGAEDGFRAWDGIEYLMGGDRNSYPFSMNVDDMGEKFILSAQVQSPAEPDRICEYMHTALGQLVDALEHAPATPVRNLDVLPVSEQRQLLAEWSENGKPHSPA